MIDLKINKACVSLEPCGVSYNDWNIIDFGEEKDMSAIPLSVFLSGFSAHLALCEGVAIGAYKIAKFAHEYPDVYQSILSFNHEKFSLGESEIFFIEEGFPLEVSTEEYEYGFNVDILTVTLDEPIMIDGSDMGREAIIGMSVIANNGKCFDFYLSQFRVLLDFVEEFYA